MFLVRLVDLMPQLVQVLSTQADSQDKTSVPLVIPGTEDEAAGAYEGEADEPAATAGWQDAYYVLLLLERVSVKAPAALSWPEEGSGATTLWEQVLKLLLHR